MTDAAFRAALGRIGLNFSGLARVMRELGDPGDLTSIRRRIQRWGTGEAKVPGEAIALVGLLERVHTACSQLVSVASLIDGERK